MMVRLSHQILLLTFCKLLLNIGRRFIYPFAPALSRGLDVPLSAVTSIIAISQFSSILGVFSGPLTDRIGYRSMMLVGMGMLVVGLFFCGFLPFYGVILAGLVLANFGKTIFDPAVQAYMGYRIPYGKRARAIGFTETSWSASTLAGIPLLGLSFSYFGINVSFILLGAFGLIGLFALFRGIPKGQGDGNENRAGAREMMSSLLHLIHSRQAVGMLLFAFFLSVAGDSVFVTYGRWFEQDFHVSLISLGFSTVAIGGAELIGESGTAFFSDRFGLRRSITAGLCVLIIAYLILPLIGISLPFAMAGLFLVFAAFEFIIVTSFSLSTELVPGARATMMAWFYGVAGLGRTVGVLISQGLWDWDGITAVSRIAALCAIIGLSSLLWGLRGWRR